MASIIDNASIKQRSVVVTLVYLKNNLGGVHHDLIKEKLVIYCQRLKLLPRILLIFFLIFCVLFSIDVLISAEEIEELEKGLHGW